jgi:hypothetical protein
MSIHYILRENKVTSDPDDQYAVFSPSGSANLDDVVDRMVQQGSTVGKPDILAVVESLTAAVESMLLDGMRVNVGGLASFYTRVGGKFDGVADSFDPARHTLDVGITTGARLRKTVRSQGTTTKDTAALPAPVLLEFEDITSSTTNTQVSYQGLGEIIGDNLQFDENLSDEGIFFIEQGTSSVFQVSTVADNFPKKLIFQNPPISSSAQYNLEVRNRQSPGGPLRTGTLGITLQGA